MNPDGANDVTEYLDALLDDSSPVAEPAAAPAATPTPAVEIVVAPAVTVPAATAPPPAAPAAPAAKPAATPGRTETGVQPGPITIAAASRWLRVVVGGDSYALELLRVQEVVRVVPIVPMRGAMPAVLGVMNLRGRIVPVFDLGLWLRAGRVEPDEQSRIVVVERDDELIGVLVSAVEDVVTLGRDRIEPPLPGNAPGVVLGVARVGACPTVLFDAYALYG